MSERYTFHIGLNIFVIRDGKLLLGKRKGVGEGAWGLPGGHMEYRESMEEGARRELKEETGLNAESLQFVNVTNDRERAEPDHYVHIGFLAENVKGEVRLTEPDKFYEWQWFELSNLPEPIFIGHQIQITAFLKKQVFAE